MMIVIEEYYLYAAIVLSFLMFMGAALIFITIRNNCPDAMIHWKAKRKGDKICRVHFRGKSTEDFIATVDKTEKKMGTPYWTVPAIGLKFKPEADAIHFIEGGIACCDYYENIPKSIKIETAVAYSQLRDYFKKIGIPIDGIEDLAFFISSESEITGPENAILDARINSEETKNVLKRYIATVNKYKDILKSKRLESGVFTWQTAMNALDSTIAYTSSSLTHTVETVRAAERRREEDKKGDLMRNFQYLAMVVIIGIILLYGLKGL